MYILEPKMDKSLLLEKAQPPSDSFHFFFSKSVEEKQRKWSVVPSKVYFKTIYYNENGHYHPMECKQFI